MFKPENNEPTSLKIIQAAKKYMNNSTEDGHNPLEE